MLNPVLGGGHPLANRDRTMGKELPGQGEGVALAEGDEGQAGLPIREMNREVVRRHNCDDHFLRRSHDTRWGPSPGATPALKQTVHSPGSIRHRTLPPRHSLQRWARLWLIRLLKILLVGLSACGLGWVWLALFVYYERFKQRRIQPSRGGRR